MSDQNYMYKDLWERSDVVNFYANQSELFEPEKIIQQSLATVAPSIRMLDIGVGAGRTTAHFARQVKYYAGIDISEAMIDKCRSSFTSLGDAAFFKVMDATNLRDFEDGSFDFVLFSYNGIDNASHDDRAKILREVKRLLAPGGYFAFSSHNLAFFPRHYSLHLSLNPWRSAKEVVKWILMFAHNGFPGKYRSVKHAILRTRAYGFRLPQYYVHPEYQLQQLKELGFGSIRLLSFSGKELSLSGKMNFDTDPWIYYWCQNGK